MTPKQAVLAKERVVSERLAAIETEIEQHVAAGQQALTSAVETGWNIGRLLLEARPLFKSHVAFGKWAGEKFGFSHTSRWNFMQLASKPFNALNGLSLREALRHLLPAPKKQLSDSPEWLRIYDIWNFAGCDDRFGQDHPGRIPGQIILNTLHYFTEVDDLVVDPMAGGGVAIDACTALGRKCIAFDVDPKRKDILRHDARKTWPAETHGCALVFLDPPYFDMKAQQYGATSVSALPLNEFYAAMDEVFCEAHEALRPEGRLALLISPSASPEHGFIDHAYHLSGTAKQVGFDLEWRISVPQSSQTVNAREVAWTKEQRRMLSLVRDLLILRRA